MSKSLISLAVASIGLLSILGLTSCGTDEAATQSGPGRPGPTLAPVEKDDPWEVIDPDIVSPSNPQFKVLFTKAGVGKLPIDAEIDFYRTDRTGVTFTVTSECGSDNVKVKTEASGELPARVVMRTLIPRALWLNLDTTEFEKTTCVFSFVATNKTPSNHRFNTGPISFDVKSMMELAPTNAEAINWAVNPTQIPVVGALMGASQFIEPSDSSSTAVDTKLSLLCETFKNSRTFGADQKFEIVLNNLFNDKLIQDDGTNFTSLVDPRRATTQQICRVFSEKIDPITKGSRFWMSRQFQLKYPLPEVEVTWHGGLHAFKSGPLNFETFAEMRIKNTNELPQKFRFPRQLPTLKMAGVNRVNGVFELGRYFSPQLHVDINGASQLTPNESDWEIEVLSGATASIKLQLLMDPEFKCPLNFELIPEAKWPEIKFDIFVGFAYHFEGDFSLRQVRAASVRSNAWGTAQNIAFWQPAGLPSSAPVSSLLPLNRDGFLMHKVGLNFLSASQAVSPATIQRTFEELKSGNHLWSCSRTPHLENFKPRDPY